MYISQVLLLACRVPIGKSFISLLQFVFNLAMLNTITKIKIKFKAPETYLPFIIKDELVDNREKV